MSIAERFNRSLRNFIFKVYKNKVWYKKLDDISEAYNERRHSSTGYTTDYLSTMKYKTKLELNLYNKQLMKNELNKFKVGDTEVCLRLETVILRNSLFEIWSQTSKLNWVKL